MNPSRHLDLQTIRAAQARITPYVLHTPLRTIEQRRLWLKCENRQRTGSFKLRGALNKVLGLGREELGRGVVAVSAGNHGLGVAYAARLRGIRATVFVPEHAVARKVAGIQAMGGDVIRVAGDYAAAEAAGIAHAVRTGAAWISPYNDRAVIAGQGTIGLELAGDLEFGRGSGWSVFLPAGGGGLLAGVGVALKSTFPEFRVIGIQPKASPYLQVHFRGGDMGTVHEQPTLAEGLAGAVEPGSMTLDMFREVADDVLLVEEAQIQDAIVWAAGTLGEVVEPSGAAALAAYLTSGVNGNCIVVLSGGNIDPGLYHRLMRVGGAPGSNPQTSS